MTIVPGFADLTDRLRRRGRRAGRKAVRAWELGVPVIDEAELLQMRIVKWSASLALPAPASRRAARSAHFPRVGSINKNWHLAHPMPPKATLDQRVAWHLEHARHCSCRGVPAGILAELKRRGVKPPATRAPR